MPEDELAGGDGGEWVRDPGSRGTVDRGLRQPVQVAEVLDVGAVQTVRRKIVDRAHGGGELFADLVDRRLQLVDRVGEDRDDRVRAAPGQRRSPVLRRALAEVADLLRACG